MFQKIDIILWSKNLTFLFKWSQFLRACREIIQNLFNFFLFLCRHRNAIHWKRKGTQILNIEFWIVSILVKILGDLVQLLDYKNISFSKIPPYNSNNIKFSEIHSISIYIFKCISPPTGWVKIHNIYIIMIAHAMLFEDIKCLLYFKQRI